MKLIDLSGKRYGRLRVLRREGTYVAPSGNTTPTWLAVCDCGNSTVSRSAQLITGSKVSCGCYIAGRMKSGLRLSHGESRRRRHSAEYRIWAHMLRRCEEPSDPSYADYGGRGIVVCERWHKFEAFLADVGRRPTARHSLDRQNNELGYAHSNCRWASPIEQANNTRRNVRVNFNGQDLTLAEWSRILQIKYHTLKHRIGRLGWSPERALTEAVQMGRRHVDH